MVKDFYTEHIVPGVFMLLNSKFQDAYEILFDNLNKLLTNLNKI